MEAITLQQIAPFFEHDLLMQVESFDGIEVLYLTAITKSGDGDIITVSNTDYYLDSDENEFSIKPILIPLQKFNAINSKEMRDLNTDISIEIELNELACGHRSLRNTSYAVVELCLENHINVFGIPDHLFIDKSTVKI